MTAIKNILNRNFTSRAWAAPFCIAAAFQIAAYLISYASRVHAMQLQLPPGAAPADRLAAAQLMWDSEILRCLFLPVRFFVGWGMFAICLRWGTDFLVPPRPVRLREVLALEMFAELIPSLGALLIALIVPSKSANGMPSGSGLSLLAFINPESWLAKMALAQLNCLQLLYIVVLTVGIARLSKLSTLKSAMIVLAVWLLAAATQISFLHLSMNGIQFPQH